MAYPNFYNPYQQPYYQQPMPDQLAQLRQNQFQQPQMQQPPQMQTQQPSSSGIIWVQGEEGAKAYMVAAGNSVLLMDSENFTFYIKSTDPSGIPNPMRVFDYTERVAASRGPNVSQNQAADYVTRQEFNELQEKLNALVAARGSSPRKRKEEIDDGESPV